MSIFDLFFKQQNPFSQFEARITRLRLILRKMEQEVQRSTEQTYLEQLKGHFAAVQRILGVGATGVIYPNSLVSLLQDERKALEQLPSSEAKQQLIEFSSYVEKEIHAILQLLREAETRCAVARANVTNHIKLQNEKQELAKIITAPEHVAERMYAQACTEKKLYDKARVDVVDEKRKAKKAELPPALELSGRIGNWNLMRMQHVLRQYGAYVIRSAGKHPYKIVKPGSSLSFPLTPGASPDVVLMSLSKLLQVPARELRDAFNKGNR